MSATAESDLGDLIAYITRYMACEQCATAYTPDTVTLALRADEITVMLVATCPVCAVERPITVYEQPPYVKLRQSEPTVPGTITSQYVAEWGAFLTDFNGDCHDLLSHA